MELDTTNLEKLEGLSREELEKRVYVEHYKGYFWREGDAGSQERSKRVKELAHRLEHEESLLQSLMYEYLYLKDLGVTSGQYKVKNAKGIEITITLSIA